LSVQSYLEARRQFSHVQGQLANVAALINQVGAVLGGSPGTFMFANQPVGLPMEATFGRNAVSADANAWPSVAQIMQLLERWHAARSALRQEWATVPQHEKDGVKPPDDLLGR
jgi:hypothetical protein